MVTMKNVAEQAGVSLITVSRVINTPELVKDTTRIKVEAAMKNLGFLPNHAAKALAEHSTRTIHLYVPRYMGISDPFTMNLIAGISEQLSEAYYLFLVRRDLEFNQRCDGVIVMGLNYSEEKTIHQKFDVPFIIFGKTELDVDCIDIDNFKGAYMLTEYMIKNGHKKIGFLMINYEQRFAHERFEGYKRALHDYNITFEERLVRYTNNFEGYGYSKSLELIEQEKPTAIFCCNDLLAIGAFRAAEKLGLNVPSDISIGGFDGFLYHEIPKKPLTTIRQPIFEAGKMLASHLLDRIKNPQLPCEKILISPELVIRESIANIT